MFLPRLFPGPVLHLQLIIPQGYNYWRKYGAWVKLSTHTAGSSFYDNMETVLRHTMI